MWFLASGILLAKTVSGENEISTNARDTKVEITNSRSDNVQTNPMMPQVNDTQLRTGSQMQRRNGNWEPIPDPRGTSPYHLTAAKVSPTRIDLSWEDVGKPEDAYTIERKTGLQGTWKQIANVPAGAMNYQDTGLKPETIYFYRVRAGQGKSALPYSNEELGSTHYRFVLIVRAFDGSQNPPLEIQARAYLDGRPIGFTPYTFYGYTSGEYKVLSDCYRDWDPVSVYFGPVTQDEQLFFFGYPVPYELPDPPSNLMATAHSSTQINITWTDNSDNESNFYLERKVGEYGDWTEYAVIGENIESYVDMGLIPNTTYFYRIKAHNESSCLGYSAYSNEDSATTPLYSASVLAHIERTSASNWILLNWSDYPNAATYVVFAADDPLPIGAVGWTLICQTSNTLFLATSTTPRKFFHVVAFSTNPIPWQTDWSDNFDSYNLNVFPANWTGSGNWDEAYVSDYGCVSYPYSLSMAGSSGGCWEALALRNFESGHQVYRFDFRFLFTGQGNIGCHGYHGYVCLRNAPTWQTTPNRDLISFQPDGAIRVYSGSSYHDIGTYTPNTWIDVTVIYYRGSAVQMDYYINGNLLYQTLDSPYSSEADMNYLSIQSGDTRCLYDDVTVSYY
jgi:hypothetical protein